MNQSPYTLVNFVLHNQRQRSAGTYISYLTQSVIRLLFSVKTMWSAFWIPSCLPIESISLFQPLMATTAHHPFHNKTISRSARQKGDKFCWSSSSVPSKQPQEVQWNATGTYLWNTYFIQYTFTSHCWAKLWGSNRNLICMLGLDFLAHCWSFVQQWVVKVYWQLKTTLPLLNWLVKFK